MKEHKGRKGVLQDYYDRNVAPLGVETFEAFARRMIDEVPRSVLGKAAKKWLFEAEAAQLKRIQELS